MFEIIFAILAVFTAVVTVWLIWKDIHISRTTYSTITILGASFLTLTFCVLGGLWIGAACWLISVVIQLHQDSDKIKNEIDTYIKSKSITAKEIQNET